MSPLVITVHSGSFVPASIYKTIFPVTCMALMLTLSSCGPQPLDAVDDLSGIDQAQIIDELHRHIEILASDEFGGRAPATRGEELTTAYLQEQFMNLGLQPGNGDSYLQEVPVTEITAAGNAVLSLRGSDYSADLTYASDMVVATYQEVEQTGLTDSDLVFVGYGIVAPEREWDDYAGVDVRGKTVVILVNDPGYVTQDPELFNGNAMTWYGRWPYKYEEAARQGAAGALIIHETGAAAYGWDVVRNSWTGPQIKISADDAGADQSNIIGWLTQDSARGLFAGAGLDLDALMAAALSRDFQAVPIGDVKASVSLSNTIRRSSSNNVIAVLPGKARPDETIIYTAHWDHLGINAELPGDNIYNGAVDNASGTAALLSLARLFSEYPVKPDRSVVFLSVTAEESGLLGSQWYSEHPLFPLAKTVANINMDSAVVNGAMHDVVVVGMGNSELEDYLHDAVANQESRYIVQEPHPERGTYYRSDHLNFARHGVPALYAKSGDDSVANGKEWGAARSQEYVDQRYHSPADEYNPDWDLTGAMQDILLYFAIGYRLSQENSWPNWYEGNEFRPLRDETAAQRN